MARVIEPTPEQLDEWAEFVANLPENIRPIAERLDCWTLYRLRETGQRVIIYSFQDDATVTVAILGKFNRQLHDAMVFGISPDELEECDLPAPDEPLGSMMSAEEVEENIDILRVTVRPDLWAMGEDGKAFRKS